MQKILRVELNTALVFLVTQVNSKNEPLETLGADLNSGSGEPLQQHTLLFNARRKPIPAVSTTVLLSPF